MQSNGQEQIQSNYISCLIPNGKGIKYNNTNQEDSTFPTDGQNAKEVEDKQKAEEHWQLE